MRLILLGPTAAGKTELSLQIAEKLNIPIISSDSRQCYKYTDIGTAKPTEEELKRVMHYNISILELDEEDSVQDFAERSGIWEKEIFQSKKIAFYTGGSTLHLQSLIRPIEDIPPANPDNLAKLNEELQALGLESLYNRLQKADPVYTEAMDGMNKQRILRALDVWMQTGRPFSSFHSNKAFKLPDDTMVFGIHRERETLYKRINNRVDMMIKKGLIEETEHILSMGYSRNLQSLNTVGYKEIIAYLNDEMSKNDAIEKIKTNTRRYAKRQLTWFRRWDFIEWLPADTSAIKTLKNSIFSKLDI